MPRSSGVFFGALGSTRHSGTGAAVAI